MIEDARNAYSHTTRQKREEVRTYRRDEGWGGLSGGLWLSLLPEAFSLPL